MSTLSIKELSHPAGEVIKIASGKTLDLKSQGSTTLPTGSVLQVKNVKDGGVKTTTSQFYNNDNIPAITHGATAFTLAITPTSATSKLLITAHFGAISSGNTNRNGVLALFKQGTSTALAAAYAGFVGEATPMQSVYVEHYLTAGTTSEIVFEVRFGTTGSGTTTINGQSGNRMFGGTMSSGITIQEIAA